MASEEPPIDVEPRDKDLQTSPVDPAPSTVAPVSSDVIICYWNDRAYLEGARIRSGGEVLVCTGRAEGPYWYNTGKSC